MKTARIADSEPYQAIRHYKSSIFTGRHSSSRHHGIRIVLRDPHGIPNDQQSFEGTVVHTRVRFTRYARPSVGAWNDDLASIDEKAFYAIRRQPNDPLSSIPEDWRYASIVGL